MPQTTQELARKLTEVIINPIIALIFAFGLLVFIWGLIEFLAALSKGGDTAEGKKHMLWGLIGLTIMTVAYAILQFIANTIGVTIPR